MDFTLGLKPYAKYLSNVGKSIGYIAIETVDEHLPIYKGFKESTSNDEIRYARKEMSTKKRFFNFVATNTGLDTFFKDVNLAYKNMKTSMKSGNFYNSRRAKKGERAMYEAMGFDTSDLDEIEKLINGDFDDNSEDSLNEEGKSDDKFEKELSEGLRDNSQIVSEAITGSAEYIAGTTRSAANVAYAQNIQSMKLLSSGFGALSGGISAINQFNSNQMQTHIKNSTQYFESTNKLMAEQNTLLKELIAINKEAIDRTRGTSRDIPADKYDEIVDTMTGAIDFAKYLKNVKENFENDSMLGMIPMYWGLLKNEVIANPMHFLLKEGLSMLGGSKVEKALDDLQKNMVNSFSILNAKLIRGQIGGDGLLGSLLQLFGIKETPKQRVDTKFDKGPMQFNGAANKAITEVIPMYLARIEAKITGQPIRVFDMETGEWTTPKDVREKWEKDAGDTGNNVREIIREAASSVVNANNIGSFSPEQQQQFTDMLISAVKTLEKSDAIINKSEIYSDRDKGIVSDEFLRKLGINRDVYGDDMIQLVGLMFDKMKNTELDSLPAAARAARHAKNSVLATIGSNPYDVRSLLVNGALNGTAESQYHLSEDANIKAKGLNAAAAANLPENRTVRILEAIYDEVFGIHDIMIVGGGGYYRTKVKGKRGKVETQPARQRVNFGVEFTEEMKNLEEASKVNVEKTTGMENLFFTKIEIDPSLDDVFKWFFDYVKGLKDVKDFSYWENAVSFAKFATAVRDKVPANYETKNWYMDRLLKTIIDNQTSDKDIFTLDNSWFEQLLINIRRKDTGKPFDIKDQATMDSIAESLGFKKKEQDNYEKLKGEGFFEKMANAETLWDKIKVLGYGAHHAFNVPINYAVKGINKFSQVAGDFIRGDMADPFSYFFNAGKGAAGSVWQGAKDLFNLVFGGGKAYGGTIGGNFPRLYALSPGEKVIPAHLNPDNPDRAKANPMMDAIKENFLISGVRKILGKDSVAGGFADGGNVPAPAGDAAEPPRPSNLWDLAKETFKNFDKIGTKEFRDKMDDFLVQHIKDKNALEAAKKAVEDKDVEGLQMTLTAQQCVDNGKRFFSNLYGGVKSGAKMMYNMLPESIRKGLEKIAPYTKAGIAAGAVSGLLGGPFGIVGGTLLGSAVGFVEHSDTAQDLLFGPGIGNAIRKFFGGKQGSTYAAVGATVGGLVGGPFGAVGGLMLGAGLNFVKNSQKFNDIIFGPKGIVARIDAFFGEDFVKARKSIADYIRTAITQPIENAMIPVGTAIQVGLRNSFKLVEKGLRNFLNPAIFNFMKAVGNKAKENKYLAGAIGGAAGGALMGGPVGAIMGGILGSIAHGTGLDKQAIELTKVPGKILNSFSNRLASWEISSGNGFNWSASERIQKMEDIGGNKLTRYMASNQYQTDTKLKNAKREDLVKVEMLMDVVSGKNVKMQEAINEAKQLIQNACIDNLCGITTTNDILKAVVKDGGKASLTSVEKIINDNPKIPVDKKKALLSDGGDLASAIENYVSLIQFQQMYMGEGGAKKAADTLYKEWSVDATSKDSVRKMRKLVSREKADKPLNKGGSLVYSAATGIVEYGEKLNKALGTGFSKIGSYLNSICYIIGHRDEQVEINTTDGTIKSIKKKDSKTNTFTTTTFSPDGGKVVRTDKVNSEGKVVWSTEEFFNKDNQRVDPNMISKDDKRDKESHDAALEKAKQDAKMDQLLENTRAAAANTGGMVDWMKKSGSKTLAASGSMGKALKDVFKTLFSPLTTMWGMFDGFMDSIPIVGDAWNYAKLKVRTSFGAAGRWAKRKVREKITGATGGWISKQKQKIGAFANRNAATRSMGEWLKGKGFVISPEKQAFYDQMMTGGVHETLSESDKQLMDIYMSTGKDALTPEQLARVESIMTSQNKLSALTDKDREFIAKRMARKGTFDYMIDRKVKGFAYGNRASVLTNKMKTGWQSLATNLTGGQTNAVLSDANRQLIDIYLSAGKNALTPEQLAKVDEILSAQNKALKGSSLSRYTKKLLGEKRAAQLGKLMSSDKNLERVDVWANRLGKVGSKVAKVGGKAVGAVAKFAGKLGGKLIGAAFDIMDTMAVSNAMEDADKGVQAQNADDAAVESTHYLAQIAGAMPVIGEFIRRQSAGGGVADLVVEGGKLAAGTIGGGAVAGGGLAATIGAKFAAAKGMLTTAKGAVIAETATKTSAVVNFIKNIFDKIVGIAKKFLKPETIAKLGDLATKIITNVTKPGVITKLAPKVAATVAKIATGPIGWAIMAGFVAHSFYKGFDDAEKIWKPREGEELTVFKKALCGVANVLYNDCLLSIVFSMDQIMGFIKQLFHDPEDDINKQTENKDNTDAKGILGRIKDAAGRAWSGLTSGFTKGYDAVTGFLGDIKKGISDTFGGFIDNAKAFGEKIVSALDSLPFKDGIGGLIESALAPLKTLYNKIFGKSKSTKGGGGSFAGETIDTTATTVTKIGSELDEFDTEAMRAAAKSSKNYKPPTSIVDLVKYQNPSKDIAIKPMMEPDKYKKKPDGDGGFFSWFRGKGDGGKDNAQEIWDYLASKGLGASAIAGIMGNIQAESSFNPRILEDQGGGSTEADEIPINGNRGYGLCQWTSIDRQRNLAAFAKAKGTKSGDLHTQLDFMLEEANKSNPGLIESMASMKDPHQAALLFHKEFERSADTPQMAKRRGEFASNIFNKQGKGIMTAGSYVGSNSFNFDSAYSGGAAASSSGGSTGVFGEISKMLENSYLGRLGTALFGSASYFTGGLFGSSGSGSLGGGTAGGAGSTRPWTGGASPNMVSGKSGCADYKQDDEKWWDAPYGVSTVAKSGCMPTSFCNMASMYGVQILPPDACAWSAGQNLYVPGTGTMWEFVPRAGEHWNVPVKQLGSWDEVLAWLKEGKPVAAGFEGGGGWSDGGHWMLLTHINERGEIYVADSRANKHETGKDISGYHKQEEAGRHWCGGAYGALNMPTVGAAKTYVVDFLKNSLKGNVTGEFGELRSDGGKHGGIDIGAGLGTIVKSPVSGSVSKIAYEPGGYGHYIQVKDNKGKYHLFAHLKEAPKLDLNHKINAGDDIGIVGSTGLSTGPHLHYQIDPESNKEGFRSGEHIDPSKYTLDENTKERIAKNNNASGMPELPQGDGDGGFMGTLTGAIGGLMGGKPGIGGGIGGGLGGADYSAKFDAIINLLTLILEAIKGGAVNAQTAGASNNDGALNTIVGGLAQATMPKMNTTTPGQSILSIIQNMLKVATN